MNEKDCIDKITKLLTLDDKSLESEIKIFHNRILDDNLSFESKAFEEVTNHLAYIIDFYDPKSCKNSETLYGNVKLRRILNENLLVLRRL